VFLRILTKVVCILFISLSIFFDFIFVYLKLSTGNVFSSSSKTNIVPTLDTSAPQEPSVPPLSIVSTPSFSAGDRNNLKQILASKNLPHHNLLTAAPQLFSPSSQASMSSVPVSASNFTGDAKPTFLKSLK
jgi:hypothetical protein